MDTALPGDERLPAAPLIMDRQARLPAPPERVWPWLLQLGKGRAGWYLPADLSSHRAARACADAARRRADGPGDDQADARWAARAAARELRRQGRGGARPAARES
jgi:hypothetical protein